MASLVTFTGDVGAPVCLAGSCCVYLITLLILRVLADKMSQQEPWVSAAWVSRAWSLQCGGRSLSTLREEVCLFSVGHGVDTTL